METLTWQDAMHDDEPRDQEADTAAVAHGYWSMGPGCGAHPDAGHWGLTLVEQDENLDVIGEPAWCLLSEADAKRFAVQYETAVVLGTGHGRAGTTPYGDLDDDDSPLMTALGETRPTTEDNHPRRLALLEAYRDAYQQAREGTR